MYVCDVTMLKESYFISDMLERVDLRPSRPYGRGVVTTYDSRNDPEVTHPLM